MNQVEIGNRMPEWSVEPLFGEVIPDITSYKGKPLLILIFSLGCPGCVGRAIPFANRMVYEYGENIQVVGIHTNINAGGYTDELFVEAKEDLYMRFAFFRDMNNDSTFMRYGAGGTPHWLLVDKEGTAIYSIFGSDPNNALLRLDLKIKELFD